MKDKKRTIIRFNYRSFLFVISKYYLATLSSHFTIENIAIIDTAQTATNTHHVIDIEMLLYIIAPNTSEKLPTAVAPSQQPCIKPCK